MASSLVGQTRARMPPMTSVLERTSSRIFASAPNYIEVTALLSIAVLHASCMRIFSGTPALNLALPPL
jgi:hypothetical protein